MTERTSTDLDAVLANIAQLDGSWRKAVFSRGRVSEGWERLSVEPIVVAAGPAAKVVYYEGNRERTETVGEADWPATLERLAADGPRHVNIMCRDRDFHARLSKRGRWLVSRGRPSSAASDKEGLPRHDREPSHALPPDDPGARRLFIETGIFSRNGTLRGEAAGKYRQVQHFLELLRPMEVWGGDAGQELRVVDAGCGRAYLSLALYAMGERLGRRVQLIGVDRSQEVLAPVRESAGRLGFERAEFVAKSIEQFTADNARAVDLLVSLHACDTATDEALAAGVRMSAAAIVLVPCCHHELVAQIEERLREGRAPNAWGAVLDSGLLTHRLADIVTDALRSAALEACGYRVSVIEFVSPEATARNVMLRAELRPPGPGRDAAAVRGRERYDALAGEWRVQPAMEGLLGDRWATR